MRMIDKKESSFDGSINISSNIKANKNTVIGKFDFKDLLIILIASIVGIIIISVLVVLLSLTNLFLIFIILAIFEVPIITIGFMNIYNMKLIDYLKMIDKSSNKAYRKQIRRKVNIGNKKQNKDINYYIIPLVINEYDFKTILEKISDIIFELKKYLNIENQYEIKTFGKKTILLVKTKESPFVDYIGLFRFLRKNKSTQFISNEDIKLYKLYLSSLKFDSKKYNKKQIEYFSKEKAKLSHINIKGSSNDKYYDLTKDILEYKDNEYIKVFEIVLYKYPFDIDVLDKLKEYSDITIHIDLKDEKFSIDNINFNDTFIVFTGSKEDVDEKSKLVSDILKKERIIYKEINEEKVRESLNLIMENRY